jgi:hypothetical protein
VLPVDQQSAELHILELERLAVDAFAGRRDPVGDLADLLDRLHQRTDIVEVGLRR